MSSYVRKSRKTTPTDGLSPLLSHIAGVIENVREATFSTIKHDIETDLGKKLSDTEVVKALENGIKLGVINMKREFKVCREFTTKELQKPNILECNMDRLYNNDISRLNKKRKMLIDYVRRERLKRKTKLNGKRKKGRNIDEFTGTTKLNDYLCHRCKKSLEKKMLNFTENSDVTSEENESVSKTDFLSCPSANSDYSSQKSEEFTDNEEKSPEKSRLLVQKNPMETDPPYCDILA